MFDVELGPVAMSKVGVALCRASGALNCPFDCQQFSYTKKDIAKTAVSFADGGLIWLCMRTH